MAGSKTFISTFDALTVGTVTRGFRPGTICGVFRTFHYCRVSIDFRLLTMSADILAIGMAVSNSSTLDFDALTVGTLVRVFRPGTICGVFRTVPFCRVSIDFRLLTIA